MTGRKAENLTGQRFGRLTIVERTNSPGDKGGPRWAARCDCGGITEAAASDLKRGSVRSCGCLAAEGKKARATHGESVLRTKEYAIWCSMKQRCTSATHRDFKNYGARGITISEEFNNYKSFLSLMGRCPEGMSLERLDNNGPYSHANCCWATPSVQGNNKRTNKRLACFGEEKTMAEWARDARCVVDYLTLKNRIGRQGWDTETALTTPLLPKNWMSGRPKTSFIKGD